MNTVLRLVGVRSIARPRAHIKFIAKIIVVLAIGLVAYLWTAHNMQQLIFDSFNDSCTNKIFGNDPGCESRVSSKARNITIALVLLIITGTFSVVTWLLHRFAVYNCRYSGGQPTTGATSKMLLRGWLTLTALSVLAALMCAMP